MELLHQFFVKLGARYVIITDSDGYCMHLLRNITVPCAEHVTDEGIIDKKTWLAFLSDLEEKT